MTKEIRNGEDYDSPVGLYLSAIVMIGSVKKFCVGQSSVFVVDWVILIDDERGAFWGIEHLLIYVNPRSIHLEIIMEGHRYVIIPKPRSTARAISVPWYVYSMWSWIVHYCPDADAQLSTSLRIPCKT